MPGRDMSFFAHRLPRALATAERLRDRNFTPAESDLEASLETFQALADLALTQVFGADGSMSSTELPVGGRGAGAYREGAPLASTLDPNDDPAMFAHIQNAMSMGAFSAPTSPGAPVRSRDVPAEDAGRTGYNVTAGGVGADPMPPIPGLNPAIMQWAPLAIWSVRQLGKLIAAWRNR